MIELLDSFVKVWIETFNVKRVFVPFRDNVYLFENYTSILDVYDETMSSDNGTPYDLILCAPPIDFKMDGNGTTEGSENSTDHWNELLKTGSMLSHDGYGIYFLEPSALFDYDWDDFESTLNDAGLYIHGALDDPERRVSPFAFAKPIIVILGRTLPPNIFIGELRNEDNARDIVHNFAQGRSFDSLAEGTRIPRDNLIKFNEFRVRKQVERLEQQLKGYRFPTLLDITYEEERYMIYGETEPIERTNAICIPYDTTEDVVCSKADLANQYPSYFYVQLKDEAFNEYVTAYFQSDLGKLVQSSTAREPSNLMDIWAMLQAKIPLPSLSEQKRIASTASKLKQLQSALDSFRKDLALNPSGAHSIDGRVDSMLESIEALTQEDKIRSMVRQGESKVLEFKESLSLDIRTETKEKYIETSSLKTIVGFLNTAGGTLLIGVSDDGGIPGLYREIDKFYKKNTDHYLLHFKDLLKTRIGEEYYPYIDYDLIPVGGRPVLQVICSSSSSPCYLDGKDFYVRTNPATDKLEGPKLVQYVNTHFK